jgi:hypothetical protein
MDAPKASYDTPILSRLGSLADVTQGIPGVPQADTLFVGSL